MHAQYYGDFFYFCDVDTKGNWNENQDDISDQPRSSISVFTFRNAHWFAEGTPTVDYYIQC